MANGPNSFTMSFIATLEMKRWIEENAHKANSKAQFLRDVFEIGMKVRQGRLEAFPPGAPHLETETIIIHSNQPEDKKVQMALEFIEMLRDEVRRELKAEMNGHEEHAIQQAVDKVKADLVALLPELTGR